MEFPICSCIRKKGCGVWSGSESCQYFFQCSNCNAMARKSPKASCVPDVTLSSCLSQPAPPSMMGGSISTRDVTSPTPYGIFFHPLLQPLGAFLMQMQGASRVTLHSNLVTHTDYFLPHFPYFTILTCWVSSMHHLVSLFASQLSCIEFLPLLNFSLL